MKFYAFDALYLQQLRSGDPWAEQHFVEYFSDLIELGKRYVTSSRVCQKKIIFCWSGFFSTNRTRTRFVSTSA